MLTFIVVAAVLALAAAAIVAIPLIRQKPAQHAPASRAALVASAVVVVGAAVLYVTLSNWSWQSAPQANGSQSAIAKLARRLERNPEDLDGWQMLGRSYVEIGQFPLAIRAYQRADRLAGGRSAEALVGWAEALALSNEAELDGRARRLIERAIELDPRSAKALFYGAVVAMRQGDLPLARQRFEVLLGLDPPANVKPILQQQIAAIDEQLASANAPAAGAKKDNAGTPTVRLNVVLSPDLEVKEGEDAPLFIIVRDPHRPGPPLAVKRLSARLPQTVELTPADAMTAGRTFSAGQEVQVVARIARGGSAMATSGDPFGEARYRVGQDEVVKVVIDRLTP